MGLDKKLSDEQTRAYTQFRESQTHYAELDTAGDNIALRIKPYPKFKNLENATCFVRNVYEQKIVFRN